MFLTDRDGKLEIILDLIKGKTIDSATVIHGNEVVVKFKEFGTPDVSFFVAQPLDSKGTASLGIRGEFPGDIEVEL